LNSFREALYRFINSKKTHSNMKSFKTRIAEIRCIGRYFREKDWEELYEVGRQMEMALQSPNTSIH